MYDIVRFQAAPTRYCVHVSQWELAGYQGIVGPMKSLKKWHTARPQKVVQTFMSTFASIKNKTFYYKVNGKTILLFGN